MSLFDKNVCEWVMSSHVDKEMKKKIFENVIVSINEYKKIENCGNDATGGKGGLPLGAKKGQRASRLTRGTTTNGTAIDYDFSEEITKAIQKLDEEAVAPLSISLLVSEHNESEGELSPLFSNAYVRPPENTYCNVDNVGEQDEKQYVNAKVYDEVPQAKEGSSSGSHNRDKYICANETDDMQRQIQGFSFGDVDYTVTVRPVMSVSESSHALFLKDGDGNDTEDGHKSYETSTDHFLEDGEDERRRGLMAKHSCRLGVSALSIDAVEMMSTEFMSSPKSPENVAFIRKVLKPHFLFSFLDEDELNKLVMVMETESFPQGAKILAKGETCDMFYVILKGKANMAVYEEDVHAQTTVLEKGAVFGDIGLMYEALNTVSVEAAVPLVCATLEGKTYKMIVSRAAEEKRLRYVSLLEKVPVLQHLTAHERSKVAEALKENNYTQGEKLMQHGERCDCMYIIVDGAADVIGRSEAGEEEYVATFHVGDCVGDLEFFYQHEAAADVVASTPVVKAVKFSRGQFETLVGTTEEFLQRGLGKDASSESSAPVAECASHLPAPISSGNIMYGNTSDGAGVVRED